MSPASGIGMAHILHEAHTFAETLEDPCLGIRERDSRAGRLAHESIGIETFIDKISAIA